MSKKLECNCCQKLTLEDGFHEICPECWWQADMGQGLDDWCYANGLTLREARENYAKYGACDPHGYWCKFHKDLPSDLGGEERQ